MIESHKYLITWISDDIFFKKIVGSDVIIWVVRSNAQLSSPFLQRGLISGAEVEGLQMGWGEGCIEDVLQMQLSILYS